LRKKIKFMLMIFLFILQWVFGLALVLFLGYIAYIMISFKNPVPYVPTPRRIVKIIVGMAEIKEGEKVCDLGSGSGKILIALAKKNKRNLIIGVEKFFLPRLVSQIRLFFRPSFKKRVQVVKADFFNIDLHSFDVIYCFLTPEAMRILEPKFKCLKPGSRLISYMFPLEDQAGFEETIEHISMKDSVYLYKKI